VRVASFGGRNIYTRENAHLLTQSGTDQATGKAGYRKWFDPIGVDPFTADGDLLDNQVVILEYANGTRATFHTNTNAAIPERRMYLLGTEGTLRAEAYSRTIELQRIGEAETRQVHSIPAPGSHAGGDAVLAPHLAAVLLENKKPLAGIHEAITSAVVAFAIDQAQATGQVVDLRPAWQRAGIRLESP
jgi:predicted dehydrogenase